MIPTPSPATIIIIVGTTSILGVLSDKFVLSPRMEEWRKGVYQLWKKLNTPGTKGLVQDANQLYCDWFDGIYGSKHFSWRRVWSSALSSMIGLVFFILVVGYKNTVFSKSIWVDNFWENFYGILLFNLIPDFFSLIETRIVLRWSRKQKLLGVLFFLVGDIICTGFIFIAGVLFVLVTIALPQSVLFSNPLEFSIIMRPESLKLLFDSHSLLVFFLTTFITSFLWWLFVLTFGIIWIFHRLHPLANFVYREIGQSDKPASVSSAFLNSLIITIYGLWVTIDWLVSIVL